MIDSDCTAVAPQSSSYKILTAATYTYSYQPLGRGALRSPLEGHTASSSRFSSYSARGCICPRQLLCLLAAVVLRASSATYLSSTCTACLYGYCCCCMYPCSFISLHVHRFSICQYLDRVKLTTCRISIVHSLPLDGRRMDWSSSKRKRDWTTGQTLTRFREWSRT